MLKWGEVSLNKKLEGSWTLMLEALAILIYSGPGVCVSLDAIVRRGCVVLEDRISNAAGPPCFVLHH